MLGWITAGAIAWGVLAFGAVYPWAYWPLLLTAAAVGGGALITRGIERPHRALCIALCAVWVAIALQLVPLPRSVLVALSPATDAFLQTSSLPYATALAVAGNSASHPLSIDADATLRSLIFLTCYILLLFGLSRWLEGGGVRRLSRRIVVIGLLVALVAIVQRVVVSGPEIYGFWTPQQNSVRSFGPFVNKNHFAGWMLMAFPLAIGLASAGLAHGMRGAKPNWCDRLVWLSSRDANLLIMVGFAAIVMGLSLVLSLSRSATAALAAAVIVSAWIAARRQSTLSRRTAGASFVCLVLLVAIGWVGLDLVATRFAAASWEDVGGRLDAWTDAIAMMRDFSLTGVGLNAYGHAMAVYQTAPRIRHFSAAHNDYLQLAAEGGLLVGIPILIAIFFFIREIRRRFKEGADDTTTYWIRVGAATGLMAIALQELVEFSLQMPGNAVLFTVLAAIAIHRPAPRRAALPRTRD